MDSRALAPADNLVRAVSEPTLLRDATTGDQPTLFGHFAVFNRWTEIDSWLEGRFLERIAPGAFTRTMDEHRDRIRVLYDHGHDPSLGNRVLGTIDTLEEDRTGAYYEVTLHRGLESEYPLLMDGLRAGNYGASFRFRVVADERIEPLKSTKANPERLMERTITDVDLYEFGPVTFPAYADASAGVRSMTDEFMQYLDDPWYVLDLVERVGVDRVRKMFVMRETVPPTAPAVIATSNNVDAPTEVNDASERAAHGPSEQKEIPTDLASRKMLARQIEAFRYGFGKGY